MKAKNKHFNIFKFSFCSFSFQALIIVIALHILADKSENKNIKYIWNFYLIISRSHLRTRYAYKKNGKRSDLAVRKCNIFIWFFNLPQSSSSNSIPFERCVRCKWSSYLSLAATHMQPILLYSCMHTFCLFRTWANEKKRNNSN